VSRRVELDLLADRRGKTCEFDERSKWREAHGQGCEAALYIQRFDSQASGAAFLLATFLWRSKEK